MKIWTIRNPKRNGTVRSIATALAIATALSGVGTTLARAADRGHDDRGRGVEQRHVARGHQRYAYQSPQAYYAPPPVDYYQPPPPSPGIDFVFPLYIR